MKKSILLLGVVFLFSKTSLFAQPGINEINSYTDYFGTLYWALLTLFTSCGAIFGIVGGVRIYTLWNTGHRHIDAKVIGWLGAAMFAFIADTLVYHML